MKLGPTLFLKVVLVLIAIGAFAALAYFPQTEGRAKDLDLISIYRDPFIIYIYITFIPFFVGLYQAFKLLGYIEQNKVFSQVSIKALRNIQYCALVFIGFIALALIYIRIMAETTKDDPAGAIALGVIMIFASSVIASTAAVFQKILKRS